MADRLLDEFPPVSKQEWLDRIVADLKGKPYEKLVRKSESGIPVAPVYTADDLPPGVESSFPGQDDLRRGAAPLGTVAQGWRICQEFSGASLKDLKALVEAIKGWRMGIRVVLDGRLREIHVPGTVAQPHTDGLRVNTWEDVVKAASTASGGNAEVWIEAGDAALQCLPAMRHLIQTMAGGLDIDPYRYRREGRLTAALVDEAVGMVCREMAHFLESRDDFQRADFRPFTVSLRQLENDGANLVQQIAFALAKASDLAARMQAHGINPSDAFTLISFEFPLSTDFFGEIAKFRAFRVLWANVLAAWGADPRDPRATHLQARPSAATATIADPYVNVLRHTTQTMAAAIGGCNLVNLPAFNAHFADADADSLRMAYNLQRVVKEEAFLHKVIDPAGGGYFVEQLTEELAGKAWAIFQGIEAAGGWLEYEASGQVAAALLPMRQQREAAVRTGGKSLLGANLYPNEREMLPQQESTAPDQFADSEIVRQLGGFGKAMFLSHSATHESHLSAAFEGLRLRMQRLDAAIPGTRAALLLTFGDIALRGARANFARNVLAAGGFACTENAHPGDRAAAIAAAKGLSPTVVVLCAADADYFDQGPAWLQAVRAELPSAYFILAGKPEGWEQLKEHGIAEAVFAGMDRIAFLEGILGKLENRKEANA